MKFVLLSFFFVMTLSASAKDCTIYLQQDSSGQVLIDETEQLAAYLQTLLENGVVSINKLKDLTERYKENKVLINPVSYQTVSGQIHFDTVQSYLSFDGLDANKLMHLLADLIRKKQSSQVAREQNKEKTKDPIYRLEFYPIPKGDLNLVSYTGSHMSLQTNHTKYSLRYDFEMMSMPLTQHHWVEIMGQNPSHFQDNKTFNHPVENITWWSALEFANRLSKAKGFVPVYDLSKIDFKPSTKAEDGSLIPTNTVTALNAVSIYEGPNSGYRLPTEKEWQFAITNRGESNNGFHYPQINMDNIQNYAWLGTNANNRTHPLSQLLPLKINNYEFYDLYGNVCKWLQDITKENMNKCVGGSFLAEPGVTNLIFNTHAIEKDSIHRSERVGLILVRTLE